MTYHAQSNQRNAPEDEEGIILLMIMQDSTSAETHVEVNNGAEAVQQLKLINRRRNALENPHQAEEAYDSLATTTAWFTALIANSGRP